ncbi:MAG: metal-dependent hydrolase [Steroidobacteraceae bacterium]
MDNFTHTLIGTLVGEAIARATPADPRGLEAASRRNLIVALSAIGSNLPDSDLLYSFLGAKVNYLLHHRGHTHTIAGALVLAGIVLAIFLWVLKRRRSIASARDRILLGAVLACTPLLHIGMDFTNNYGVHPFWPFDNDWFYGDAVFIAEPLLWAACTPLIFLLRTSAARSIATVVLATGMALALLSGFVPLAPALALVCVTTGMVVLAWRAQPRVALTAAITLWIAVTVTFVASSALAGRRADAIARDRFPQARLLDHILTPMPANPLCWEMILIQQEQERLLLRRGTLSLAPQFIPANACLPRSPYISQTASLAPVGPDTPALDWHGEIATDLVELRRVVGENCEAAAAMRFIRAPWLIATERAKVLGDLRYDREKELGFAEVELADPPRCPPIVPPWGMPRADLFG